MSTSASDQYGSQLLATRMAASAALHVTPVPAEMCKRGSTRRIKGAEGPAEHQYQSKQPAALDDACSQRSQRTHVPLARQLAHISHAPANMSLTQALPPFRTVSHDSPGCDRILKYEKFHTFTFPQCGSTWPEMAFVSHPQLSSVAQGPRQWGDSHQPVCHAAALPSMCADEARASQPLVQHGRCRQARSPHDVQSSRLASPAKCDDGVAIEAPTTKVSRVGQRQLSLVVGGNLQHPPGPRAAVGALS